MNILVTGNLGYVGSSLLKNLKNLDYNVIGLDTNLYGSTILKKEKKFKQIYKDFREIKDYDLKNIDAIVHLAAVSNDPIGNFLERATYDINFKGTVKLAKIAKKNKVKKFIFASSCSVYGFSGSKLKNERSKTNPLTAYAKSKLLAEKELKKIEGMSITSLRFATAMGYSSNMRFDLVLNDFVFSALKYKKINILSNGKPLRPVIHVDDMSKAIIWAINRNEINFLTVNVGSSNNNLSVYEMAKKVSNIIPCSISINKINLDSRSYQVDFSIFEKKAKQKYCPSISIDKTIKNLAKNLLENKKFFKTKSLEKSKFIRLNTIRNLIKKGKISKNLKWK